VLTEAFQILGAEDVLDLLGAANAWDTVDEVLIRYFDERLVTSPRQRMAVTGRSVEFEALLLEIAEPASQGRGLARPRPLNLLTG